MDQNLGARIKNLRRKTSKSQIQLSLDLHVSREMIAKIEIGERVPSIELLLLISDYFHVSTDYLLKGERFNQEILMELNSANEKLRRIEAILSK